MRIWQAGKKREAVTIGINPLDSCRAYNWLRIGGTIVKPWLIKTTGLYTGEAILTDGANIKYSWDSKGRMVIG